MTSIIAGQYRHRNLATPKGDRTRPTTSQLREALFNICQGYIEGAHFLDLFAGSGAVGFEALSRGAASVVFIESDKLALKCIKQNVQSLQVEDQSTIYGGDVFRYLEYLQKKSVQFDIIFADPPYQLGQSEKVIRFVDESSLLTENGVLFVEEASNFEPEIKDLKTLKLKNSRRIGSAVLQQYVVLGGS